jgi:hypothetical protein
MRPAAEGPEPEASADVPFDVMGAPFRRGANRIIGRIGFILLYGYQ